MNAAAQEGLHYDHRTDCKKQADSTIPVSGHAGTSHSESGASRRSCLELKELVTFNL